MSLSRTDSLQVPNYVFATFSKTPPQNLEKIERYRLDKMTDRENHLVNAALDGLTVADWEIQGTHFKSQVINEPYGLERALDLVFIYAEEKGVKKPICIFKDSHLAAEYFVQLVSNGTRKIDWSLYLDMLDD